MVGDLNKHVGNDDLEVEGNHDKISIGQLVSDLLATGEYYLVNNKCCVGGPGTRIDPGNVNKKSFIDLVICSDNLLPYIDKTSDR